jgi:hypothetical protein
MLVKTVSRFVQLTRLGLEYRGECPGCKGLLVVSPARKKDPMQCRISQKPETWFCLGCGSQEVFGNNEKGFVQFTLGMPQKLTKPRSEPKPTPRLRVAIPTGSVPNFSPRWLGTPSEVKTEYDKDVIIGYLATYRCGPMRWRYVKISGTYGEWKVSRLPMRERLTVQFPEIPEQVAKVLKGRDRITMLEILREIDRPWKAHLTQAIGRSIRTNGWFKHQAHSGLRFYSQQPVS